MAKDVYCVVDIGGTKILLLLIDDHEQVLFRIKTATPDPADPETIIATLDRLIKNALSETDLLIGKYPSAIGICIAGFIDYQDGLVYQAPNLNWTTPVHLRKSIESTYKCSVLIENDANAAVLGEVCFGAAKNHQDVIYITLSTGIGGGLYLDNRIYRGCTGFAGEIGHIKPYGKGRMCKCGGYDCLETWASGSAIVNNAKSLWSEEDINCKTITTLCVFEQAEAGNTLAKKIIDHAAENIGRGLANLVNILNPSCIVIGGGVAANNKKFFEKVSRQIKAEAIRPAVEITPLEIFVAQLESESGVWGMYALMTKRTVD